MRQSKRDSLKFLDLAEGKRLSKQGENSLSHVLMEVGGNYLLPTVFS
jgi:hypothetical protein